jgi:type II secretory pathway pseudopilin PulG
MPRSRVRQKRIRRGDSGYMLLVLMLATAVLTITMLGVARNYRRGIQRDREVEMIHRGEQYARAVRRYYKKFGRYPNTIEQLEDTNKIRFLRKRYKDPMSPDGEWKLAHLTDIKFKNSAGLTPAGGAAGQAASSDTSGLGTGSSNIGSSNTSASDTSASGTSGPPGTANQSTDGTITGTTTTTGTSSLSQGTGVAGSAGVGNAANQVLGGGALLGVVSKQKTEGIHAFGDMTKYNEWFFIYVQSQDKGQLLVGPYNPNMFVGTANSGLGNSNKGPSGIGTGSATSGSGTSNPAAGTTTPPANVPTNTP